VYDEHPRTEALIVSDQSGQSQGRQPLDPSKRPSFGSSPSIFISYRRDDSSGSTGRLYDRLVAKFGEDRVFMDIDTIRIGDPFAVRIEEALANCAACLVVIGRMWESITVPNGSGRRLDDPTDFVRLEVAGALRSGAKVFPVLVDGGSMPDDGTLPEDIQDLVGLQAIQLRGDSWNYDVGRLILALEGTLGLSDDAVTGSAGGGTSRPGTSGSGPLGGGTSDPTPRRRLKPMTIGIVVILAIALVVGVVWLAAGTTTSTSHTASTSTGPTSSVSPSGDCVAPSLPATSITSPTRFDGIYAIELTLMCRQGTLGANKLWKNVDPQVGEEDWPFPNWRFEATCESGACNSAWTVPGRSDVDGAVYPTGTTYAGTSKSSADCDPGPAKSPTLVDRQLRLAVTEADESGLAMTVEGSMTITWTCEDTFLATFRLSGSRISS
jgi:TIR domain